MLITDEERIVDIYRDSGATLKTNTVDGLLETQPKPIIPAII